MYANLLVHIDGGADVGNETVSAWGIVADRNGATLMLDAQDGTGTHAEPAGERKIDLSEHTIAVEADF